MQIVALFRRASSPSRNTTAPSWTARYSVAEAGRTDSGLSLHVCFHDLAWSSEDIKDSDKSHVPKVFSISTDIYFRLNRASTNVVIQQEAGFSGFCIRLIE